ncbi:MAG: hypothetical protein R2780_12245 [Crocinitomicaceae bacterium]|nr:hypothetical protein [Crocinitomicaceae bacterium]
MKKIILFIAIFGFTYSYGQGADTLLQGKWVLFKIIDNMSGETITPSHKTTEAFEYFIEFTDNQVKYNLEVNKCENEIIVGKDRSIEFKYFSNCTSFCCDADFSNLLTYSDCTKYYIKGGKTLVLVSEDRIFYFSRPKE